MKPTLVPFAEIVAANRSRQQEMVTAFEQEMRQGMIDDLETLKKRIEAGDVKFLIWAAGFKDERPIYGFRGLPEVDYATMIGVCEIMKESMVCLEFGHDDDPEG